MLNEVDHIYHLNEHGLQHTTGNYEKFYEQYQSQIEALEQSVHQHQREVKHMKQKQHEVLMKAQNVSVLATNFVTQTRKLKFCSILKEQAGQSLGAIHSQQQRQIDQSQQDLKSKKYF